MNRIHTLIIAAAALLAGVLPASAQFRWGVRLGTEVNAMRFDKDVFNNENRAGFTGGLTAEVTVPIVNIAVDASLMYVHRVSASEPKLQNGATTNDAGVLGNSHFRKRDYFEIPVNFKYKFGLPVVGRFLSPFVQTGPTFAFLASKKDLGDGYKNRTFNSAWNFGAGVEILHKVQISANYGVGMNNVIENTDNNNVTGSGLNSKNNYWTITAAWFF